MNTLTFKQRVWLEMWEKLQSHGYGKIERKAMRKFGSRNEARVWHQACSQTNIQIREQVMAQVREDATQ